MPPAFSRRGQRGRENPVIDTLAETSTIRQPFRVPLRELDDENLAAYAELGLVLEQLQDARDLRDALDADPRKGTDWGIQEAARLAREIASLESERASLDRYLDLSDAQLRAHPDSIWRGLEVIESRRLGR